MAKILIVDDDKDILRMVETILGTTEHYVRTCIDPVNALELLKTMSFDLFITDANMPKYTGFELIKSIRADKNLDGIAIAMLTSARDKDNVQKAVEVGVDSYIVKPIDPVDFIEKVDSLLSKSNVNPPQTLELSSASEVRNLHVTMPAKLLSVHNQGASIFSLTPMPVGASLRVDGDLFNQLDLGKVVVKVLDCKPTEGGYEIFLSLLALDGDSQEKLKSYIYHELRKRKVKVS